MKNLLPLSMGLFDNVLISMVAFVCLQRYRKSMAKWVDCFASSMFLMYFQGPYIKRYGFPVDCLEPLKFSVTFT